MDATTEEAPKSLFRLKMKVLPLPQEIKIVLPTLTIVLPHLSILKLHNKDWPSLNIQESKIACL